MTASNCPIVLACAADDAYAMPLAVMIRSVLENVKGDRKIIFFVIDAGIKEFNKRKILNSLNTLKSYEINWVQAPTYLPDNLPLTRDVLPHASKAVYYRLLLPEILPINCKKVIYLDSDLIVIHNLDEIWEIDIKDNYVLAVQDSFIPLVSSPYGLVRYEELGISENTKYFNSGVLIINLEKWRTDSVSQKSLRYLDENRKHINHHDQDALNAIIAGRWGELEPKWNQTPILFNYTSWRESPYREMDYDNAIHNPYIVHFASSAKPWNSYEAHPARNLFFHYLDMTAWSGWRFTVWTRLRRKLIKIASS